jgi:hypothetical protein
MTVTTSAGATLGITATKPATFDKTGYAALAMTLIGEITNLGDFGRVYDKVEHKPLANRGTVKKKGGYDDGALALTIGCDEKDAGQALLEAASTSDADYFFAVTRQDGTVHYFPAQVMSFKRSVGERNNITNVTSSLEITSYAGVGIVTVKPA